MSEEEIRKITKEYAEMYLTKGIDSTKIFKYVDELEKEVEQLENIIKEAVEYINHATIGADSSPIEDSWLYNLYETRHILNKGENNE